MTARLAADLIAAGVGLRRHRAPRSGRLLSSTRWPRRTRPKPLRKRASSGGPGAHYLPCERDRRSVATFEDQRSTCSRRSQPAGTVSDRRRSSTSSSDFPRCGSTDPAIVDRARRSSRRLGRRRALVELPHSVGSRRASPPRCGARRPEAAVRPGGSRRRCSPAATSRARARATCRRRAVLGSWSAQPLSTRRSRSTAVARRRSYRRLGRTAGRSTRGPMLRRVRDRRARFGSSAFGSGRSV